MDVSLWIKEAGG